MHLHGELVEGVFAQGDKVKRALMLSVDAALSH